MEKVRRSECGVRSLPWRFSEKMVAFVRINLKSLELRCPIGSQFWARARPGAQAKNGVVMLKSFSLLR